MISTIETYLSNESVIYSLIALIFSFVFYQIIYEKLLTLKERLSWSTIIGVGIAAVIFIALRYFSNHYLSEATKVLASVLN